MDYHIISFGLDLPSAFVVVASLLAVRPSIETRLLEGNKMADGSFDAELRKAFQDLQVKVVTTTQQVKIAEAQVDQLKRSIQHAKLTDKEIEALPEGTNTYESIGRMFVLQPIPVVRENLKNKMDTLDEKIKGIEVLYIQLHLQNISETCRDDESPLSVTRLILPILQTNFEPFRVFKANKEYLQKSVKEQENSIREMLQQRR